MHALVRLWPLALVSGIASCAFLLDYDELQSGSDDAGADVSSGGGQGGSGGGPTGGTGGGGTAGSGGNSTGGQSGTGGDAGTDAPTGIPLGQLAAELAKAACANSKACYGPAIELVTKGAECEAWVTASLEDVFVGSITAAGDAGVSYDALKGAECVAALEKVTSDAGTTCPELSKLFEWCKSALSGLANENGPCKSTMECGPDLYCDSGASCTCKPYLSDGAACTQTVQCKKGLTCFSSSTVDAGALEAGPPDSGIKPGSCKPYTLKDAACGQDTPECEPGTLCMSNLCLPATYLFIGNVGQQCYTTKILCKEGLACEFNGFAFASTGECVTDIAHTGCKLALPDSCGKNNYCKLVWGGNTCEALPIANQTCAKDWAQFYGLAPRCQPGLVCVNDKCVAEARLGQVCVNDAHCVSGHCASATDAGPAKCEPPTCKP